MSEIFNGINIMLFYYQPDISISNKYYHMETQVIKSDKGLMTYSKKTSLYSSLEISSNSSI